MKGLVTASSLHRAYTPGQIVHAALFADQTNSRSVAVGIQRQSYGHQDQFVTIGGPQQILSPGETIQLEWRKIPDLAGFPIAQVGISISSAEPAHGIIYLDHLSWDSSSNVNFQRLKIRLLY